MSLLSKKPAKFIGGAEEARRKARKKAAATPILRPGETAAQRNREFLSQKMPSMERFFASLLKSNARDFLDSKNSKERHSQLYSRICERLGLRPLVPPEGLQPFYQGKAAHFDSRASLVMEESRHAISEGLAQRWSSPNHRRAGGSGGPMSLCLESMQKRKEPGHVVLRFSKRSPFSPSELYNIRPGCCFEILPPGPKSIDRVLLGNVVSNGRDDYDDDHTDHNVSTLSLMVYKSFDAISEKGDWQVAPVTALITMVRQFESCTTYGRNVPFVQALMGCKEASRIRFDSDAELVALDKVDSQRSINFAETEEEKKEEQPSAIDGSPALFCLPNLNRTQEEASRTFLDALPNSVTLVQGPPGTGKTTLLTTIICRYLMESLSMGKKRRLLVCAPTNKAVSVVATRYIQSLRRQSPYTFNAVMIGDQDKLLVEEHHSRDGDSYTRQIFAYTWIEGILEESRSLRQCLDQGADVGLEILDRVSWLCSKLVKSLQARRVNEGLLEVTASVDDAVVAVSDAAAEANQAASRRVVEALKGLEHYVRGLDSDDVAREVLRSADVIFCTLASAGALIMKMTDNVEDLIVDEAAASTEPELYIPFHLKPKRLLAVGDPMQLPATVLSRYAERLGLSHSLHERLMYQLKKENVMLDVQYRMKPDIGSFPSRYFYSSKLANGDNVNSPLYKNSFDLLTGAPYTFLQTAGTEKLGSMGSYFNTAEACAVRELVAAFRNASVGSATEERWFSSDRIRVITFYQAQVSLIKQLLRESGLGQVMVATVDSSQGCEADVVIVSFVRTNNVKGGGLQAAGFLTDDRRLNVSLTRAKYQLVCVGNAKGLLELRGAETLKALAQDAFERDCIMEGPKTTTSSKAGKRNQPKQKRPAKRRKKG